MRILRSFLPLLGLASGYAEAQDHAIGAKIGALGLGIEYSYMLTDRLVVRGGINGSGFSFDEMESGIEYDFDLDFDSISAGVDVHPMRGAFRISAGFLANDSTLTASGIASGGNFEIGGDSYTANEIGGLTGSIGFDSTAPFLGLGWDWRREKRLGITFEMGVVDQGAPYVSLVASGPIADDPGFLADLAAEEAELRDSVDDLDIYPYAAFGLAIRF